MPHQLASRSGFSRGLYLEPYSSAASVANMSHLVLWKQAMEFPILASYIIDFIVY